MTVNQKDWDFILLTICHREVELEDRLRDSRWKNEQIQEWKDELATLRVVKKKVVDKLN